MKKFKSRKRWNNLIIYLGFFLISVAFSIKYLYENDLINDDTIINTLINDNLGNLKTDIDDVDFLLKYALNVDLTKENKPAISKVEEIKKENNNIDNQNVSKEQVDNKVITNNDPVIYIYNSHQEEKYESNYLEPYNINTTVFMASKILKEYLEEQGLKTIVEEGNISEKLKSLNLNYSGSYKASRVFLEEAKKNNPTLKYFIDLHRDASKYENTTLNIDGENYAKILFVIGLDNANYLENLKMAEKLKSKIEEFNKDLFRGIMQKKGVGVNGVYNQDFSANALLIEVGGEYNNISEVNNTLKVLANILAEYIEEDQN